MLFDDNALLDKMLNDRKGSKVLVRGRKEFFLRKIKIIYELLINKPFRVAAKTALNWAYRRELGPRLGVPTIPVNDLFNWNDLEINLKSATQNEGQTSHLELLVILAAVKQHIKVGQNFLEIATFDAVFPS